MNQRLNCEGQGLNEQIVESLMNQALLAHGVANSFDLIKAGKQTYHSVIRMFAFLAFDSPHFASKKEVAHYGGIPYATACIYYQDFVKTRRRERDTPDVDERPLQHEGGLRFYRHSARKTDN